MSEAPTPLAGPDLSLGVAVSEIPDAGMLLGHADGEPVLLARRASTMWAMPRRGTSSRSTAMSRRRTVSLRFKRKGRVLAVASIFRDTESLKAEAAMEQAAGVTPTPAV